MDTKTLGTCLPGRHGCHHPTSSNYTIKELNCLQTSEVGRQQRRSKKRNQAKRKSVKETAYKRLTIRDRTRIYDLLNDGKTAAQIARILSRSRSTITREIKRNKSQKGYRFKKAQKRSDARMRVKASKRHKLTREMWLRTKELLKKGWTFEQISERMRRDGIDFVCKETLYCEYYERQRLVLAGKSLEDLPLLPMRRRKRKTRDRNAKKYRTAGRGKIPGRIDISERPKNIDHRARIGHWEGDLINGLNGTGNLVTAVERFSRFTLVGYSATKETDSVMTVFLSLFQNLPPEIILTLTLDNGKEFSKFKILMDKLGIGVYFAKPYHSWERGTNENRNGIVRKVLPKGSSFDNLTDKQLQQIDYMLNDRPLKCLNWRTPREVFTARLKYILSAI